MVTVARVHHGRENGGTENVGFAELFHQIGRKHEDAFIRCCRPGNSHEHLVQTEEDRHLGNNRQAGGKRVGAVFFVQRHLLLCHRLAGQLVFLPLVFGLKLSDIALHGAHTAHRFNLFDEERDGEGTHNQGQADNAQHPGQA